MNRPASPVSSASSAVGVRALMAALFVSLVTLGTTAQSAQDEPVPAAGAEATAAPTEPAPPAPDTDPPPAPPRKGLMIADWATFGGGWLFSALVGALMLSNPPVEEGETCTNCDSVGPAMFIPLAGPFIAIPDADGTDGKVVAAVLGVVQVVGLVLAIAGTSVYAVRKKEYDEQIARETNPLIPRLALDVAPGPTTSGHLSLSWRF